jgi:PAS domain S-box-containing protein
MLQNLSEQIRLCYARASEAKERAEETTDSEAKADFSNAERRWLLLARSYERSENLTDFIRAIPERSDAASTPMDGAQYPSNWEDHLQKVIDNTPFMLTRCSSDLRYQFVSRAYAQMLGREPKDIVGKPMIDIIGEEAFNAILPHIQQVLRGNRIEYETEIHYQGIGQRVIRAIYTPDRDQNGMVGGWIGSIIDISDRAHAVRLRKQLASIVDSSDDAIVSKDLDGVIVSWNKGAERIFGYSADEVVGKPITVLMPPDRQDEESTILEHIRRGERIDHYETKRRHKDGRLLDISLTVSPVKDEDGRVVGASKVARDITYQKGARERMAADLWAMTMLREVGSLCAREGENFDKCLKEILEVAIAIVGAYKGNIQLREPEAGVLRIATHRGFGPAFLENFEYVGDSSSTWAAAMVSGERVIVEDVTTSEIFVGQPSMNALIDEGVRAVISTPLISAAGNVLGTISTHFRESHHPAERELGLLDLLARQAADYLERRRAEEIEEALVREIQHRSNNQLAVIQAIAHQTFSGDRSMAKAKKAFDARLGALARANRQLAESNWSRVSLSEIMRLALSPFGDRTMSDGVDVMLGAQHVQNFSLVLHELATNAAKYGALSNESGWVEIFWTIAADGDENILKFRWKERGGPPVVPPTRHGFGTSLLKAIFTHVRIDYSVEGLTCEIDLLLDRVRSGRPRGPSAEEIQPMTSTKSASLAAAKGR